MVAIVNGQGLGINLGSAGLLGQRAGNALAGQNGQKIFLNASNGNLVVQHQDQALFDNGLDLGVLRTYNSQGLLNDDNGDNWSTGFYARRAVLSGEAAAQDSFITLTAADGAASLYAWDSASGKYTCAQGDGVPDTIIVDGAQLVWTDPATGLTELYNKASGRLEATVDAAGHRIDYLYAAGGMLASATSNTGVATTYDYVGNQLAQTRSVTQDADGNWQQQVSVRYAYDAQGRLEGVEVDLSPEDGQVADGKLYRTTYTYDGASRRLASIAQSDGTALSFTYVERNGVHMLATLTDALQASTRFSYDVADGTTTIDDPATGVTVLHHDAQGRLLKIDVPAPGGQTSSTRYAYNEDGDVVLVEAPQQRSASMEYDALGNQLLVRDAAGNTTRRSFGAAGQVLSETVYLAADPDGDGPLAAANGRTTRHYYDATVPTQLRFTISAEGRITEYRYNGQGQRVSVLEYAGQKLDAATLDGTESVATIAARVWAATPASDLAGATRRNVQRIDMAYDAHGQLAQRTRYSQVLSDQGATGVADGASIMRYVSNQSGQVLGWIDVSKGEQGAYTYDGLGRVLTASQTGGLTVTQYDDAGNRVIVTGADQSVTTRTFDRAGRLVAVAVGAAAGQTAYFHDAAGRLRMTQLASGERSFTYYGEGGLKAAEVDAAGRMREFSYNRSGELVHTQVYGTLLDLSTLVDGAGRPLELAVDAIRPAPGAADQGTWRTFDAAGRHVHTIAANGMVTETRYDGASRAVAQVRYANAIVTGGLAKALSPLDVVVAPAPADQLARTFYDADGLQVATLDVDGRLVQSFFDGAGRLVETRAYARPTTVALRAAGTLAELTATLKDDLDARTVYKLDGQANVLSQTSVQGYPEEALPGIRDITGTISQPGEQDVYEFTLAEKTRFFFDGVQGDQTQWVLRNGNVDMFSSRNLTATSDKSLELGAGTYRLTVDGTGERTGNYSFRMLGEEAATVLPLGQAVAGQLAAGGKAMLYAFSAQAGDRLYFQAGANASALRYSVFGADGRMIDATRGWGDSGVMVAERTGSYWISIESQGPSASALPFGFTLHRSVPVRQAYTPGATARAALSVPGAALYLTMDITEAGWLRWDQLSASTNLNWWLYNADGAVVASASGSTDERAQIPAAVVAGRYTLVVDSQARNVLDSDVRMVFNARAQVADLASGQTVSISGSAGREDRVFKLRADGPTMLSLTPTISTAGQNAHFQVMSSTGHMIDYWTATPTGQSRNFYLPIAGDYYVMAGATLANTAPMEASVTALTWNHQIQPALTLSGDAPIDIGGTVAIGGSGTAASQSVTTTLVVPQSGLWAFETTSAFTDANWSLTGGLGSYASGRLSNFAGKGAAVRYLTAGSYQLTVNSTSYTQGPFAIRATPLSLAAPLVPGQSAAIGELAIGQSLLLRADSAPRDLFKYTLPGATNQFSVSTFNAVGDTIGTATGNSVTVNQNLATGPLYFRVTRVAAGAAGATLALTRTPAVQPQPVALTPITVGVAVSAPASSGASLQYSVDLATDGWVSLAWQGGSFTGWKMNGPAGDRSATIPATGWRMPRMWLAAGQYTMTLTGAGGAAAFTLLDASTVQPMAAGTDVLVDLAPEQAYALFEVWLDGAMHTDFHGLAGASAGNSYRLYNSEGAQVASGDPASANFSRLSTPLTGRYQLAISRSGGAALRFGMVQTPRESSSLALQVNGSTSGQFLQYGQQYNYSFSTANAAQLTLAQTLGSGLSFGVYDAFGNSIGATSAPSGRSVFNLAPGQYSVRATNYYQPSALANPLQFAFNATLNGVAADLKPDGVPVALNWVDGSPDRQFNLALEAGKSYSLTRAPSTSGNTEYYWFRLLDQQGKEVSTGSFHSYNNMLTGAKLNAQQTGNYTLQIMGYSASQGPLTTSTAFVLRQGQGDVQAYVPGTTIDSQLNHPGDNGIYRFTLADDTPVWFSIQADQYTVTLQRTDLAATVYSTTSSGGEQLRLAAGSYELRITPRQVSPGKFHFNLTPVADLPAMPLSTEVITTLAEGRHVQAYRLAGRAGQALMLDPRWISGNYTNSYFNLVGPDGASVTSGYGYSGASTNTVKVTLPRDGDYVLLLGSHGGDTAPHTSGMRIDPYTVSSQQITLGAQVQGVIGARGNVNRYSFTLQEDTTVVLDARGGTASLVLSGPRGNELSTTLRNNDADFFPRRLPAGTYTIEIKGSHALTPDFNFRLLSLADAALDQGAAASFAGQLPAGQGMALYRMEVVAGRSYNFSLANPIANQDYTRYTLLDSYGRAVVPEDYSMYQSVNFTAPVGGAVYLVAKQYYGQATATNFTATLRQPVTSSVPLELGASTTLQLASRSDLFDHRFQMDESGWIHVEGIRAPSASTVFEFVAPDGTSLHARQFNPNPDGNFSFYLPRGDYALRVRVAGDSVYGPVTFKTRLIPAAVQFDRQPTVARALDIAAGSDNPAFFTLDARAGDRLQLLASAWAGAGTVEILSPDGGVQRTWTPAKGSTLTYDFTQAGPNLVRVYRANPATNAVAFQATWGVAAPAAEPIVSTLSGFGTVTNGSPQSFQFEVTARGLWYADSTPPPEWINYHYTRAAIRDADGLLLANDYRVPVMLDPGVYTVTIRQDYSSAEFNFTMRQADAPATPVLSVGQPVSVTLPMPLAATVYKMEASAGDKLRVNLLASSGAYGSMQFSVYNEWGQLMAPRMGAGGDSAPFTVRDSGSYYLVLHNATYPSSAGVLSFQIDNMANVLDQEIVLGQVISGTLDGLTQARYYTLNLTQTQIVQFDRLNAHTGANVNWSLTGPHSDGQMVNEYIYNSTNSYDPGSIMTLRPGQYRIAAYSHGTTFNGGAYAFRLLAHADTTALVSGQWVDGQVINNAGEATSYGIDAKAGDRLFINLRNVTPHSYNSTTGRYNYTDLVRVFDAYGTLIHSGSVTNAELIAPTTGRYVVQFDSSVPGEVAASFSLAVFVNAPANVRVIDFGAITQAVDLVVRNVAVAPAVDGGAIASGTTVRVSWDTVNNGVESTLGEFSERIVVRKAGTGEVVLQASVPYRGAALLPGDTRPRMAELRLPDGLVGSGNLTVTVETDAASSQNENGPAAQNNLASTSIVSALSAYANLTAAGLALDPASNWQAGDQVTVRWNTANTGNAAATGAWSERVELVNTSTGAVIVRLTLPHAAQQLEAGAQLERAASFAWPSGLNAVGNFRLRVLVDTLGQVAEYGAAGALESDNTAERLLAVGPDLTVRNVTLLDSSARDGDTVTLVWEDVNEGSVAAPAGYQDRVVVRQRNADGSAGAIVLDTAVAFPGDNGAPLAVGQARSRLLRFTLPAGLRGSGDFIATVTADTNASGVGTLFETNASGSAETNNSASGAFSSGLHEYANLAVTEVLTPTAVLAGADMQVTWTVQNSGAVRAAGTWVDRVVLTADGIVGNADDILLTNVRHGAALDTGAAYTQSATVRIPGRIMGDYRIAVITDVNLAVAEPDTRADNIRMSAPIAVSFAFTDLVPLVTSAPDTAFANRTTRVEWSVNNAGTLATDVGLWVDQVYLSSTPTLTAAATLLGSVTHTGAVGVGGSYSAGLDVKLPANAVGQYYFIVKTDAFQNAYEPGFTANNTAASAPTAIAAEPKSNLSVTALAAGASWRVGEQVQVSYTVANDGNDVADSYMVETLRLVNLANPAQVITLGSPGASRRLAVGASFTHTASVTVPAMPLGQWRLEVVADVNGYVAELNEADNVRAQLVTVTSPELAVEAFRVDGEMVGGATLTLSWTTRNSGTADAAGVRDAVYLSRDGVIGAGDIKLGEVTHTLLAAGAAAASQLSYQLPVDAAGSYKLIVITDAANAVNENGVEANNLALQDAEVLRDLYADLAVTSVTAPSRVIDDPATVTVSYTVVNQGPGAGRTASWTDLVVYSDNLIVGDADDIVLGTVRRDGALQAGEAYTGSVTYQFAPGATRHGHVFVRTDSTATVWENSLEANNTARAADMLDVVRKPYADLRVESVTAGAPALSGQPLSVSWTVANRGIAITDTNVWSDTVWLSANADGSGVRYELGASQHLGRVDVDGGYTRTMGVTLPEGITGTFYLHVKTGGPFEFIYTDNNLGSSAALAVTLSDSPDLAVTNVVSAATANEGEVLNVSWTVRNQGVAMAAGDWIDKVELVPTDATKPAIVLGTYSYAHGLQPGIDYTRTEEIRLPARVDGMYRLRVSTNSGDRLFEYGSARSNNVLLDGELLTIEPTARPDLRVGLITAEERITAGTSAGISFEITNLGTLPTSGQWSDAVYLSLDGKVGPNAILLGRIENNAALEPTRSYTSTLAAFDIPVRFRGDAYLIVVADVDNRVSEYPNETNNIGVKKIVIDPVPLADLVTSDVVAADQATHGASVNVTYKVTNKGSAATRGDSAAVNSWTDSVWLTVDKRRPSAGKGDILLGTVKHTGHLGLNEDYLGELNVTLPEGLASGSYHITVWTDTYGAIAQDTLATNVNPDDPATANSNDFKARAIAVLGTRPDLAVTGVQAPAQALAGGAYSFSYSVTNMASPLEGEWKDRVWLIDNADFSKATKRWLLGEYEQKRSLGGGEQYSVSDTVKLNPSATGAYLYVETDHTNAVREIGELDNAKARASVVTATPADLKLVSVSTVPQNFSGEDTVVTWTVENLGGAVWAGTRGWVDNIYISKDPSFIAERATQIGSVVHSNETTLAAGGAYTSNATVKLPPGTDGQYYIYVITDAAKPGGIL